MRIPEVNGTASSPRQAKRLETDARMLVRRPEMGAAALAEALGDRLEHDSHRDRHLAQRPEVLGAHDARIEVRQKTRLLEHELCRFAQVRERGLMAEARELIAGDAVAQLGLVAEREEGLVAARLCAGARDLENLLGRHERPLALAGRLGERAVVADVAAQHGQRDEHLR